ncbi:hypothetical protein QYF36_004676 [Acer negundo]|nr:hypothetical protein QYF36_004676 [Acer negundo]
MMKKQYWSAMEVADVVVSIIMIVVYRGCCGIGRNKGQITCLPFSIPCLNRDEFIFWDAYHPTQAFNQIIAEKAFNGGLSVCYPMNVKQMAQV